MITRSTAPVCREWPRMVAASLAEATDSAGNPEPKLDRPSRPSAASPLTVSTGDPAALVLLLGQEDLDLDLVAGLVTPNTGLADRVLRLANSVTFNRGVPVHSVSEAVARLGFGQLLQLIKHPEGKPAAPA